MYVAISWLCSLLKKKILLKPLDKIWRFIQIPYIVSTVCAEDDICNHWLLHRERNQRTVVFVWACLMGMFYQIEMSVV